MHIAHDTGWVETLNQMMHFCCLIPTTALVCSVQHRLLLHVLTVCLCTTKKCFYHTGAYLQVPWRTLAVLCGVQATQVLTLILCHVGRRKAEFQPWRMIPLRYLCYKCLFTEWSAVTQLWEESIFFTVMSVALAKNSRTFTFIAHVCLHIIHLGMIFLSVHYT